MTAVFTKYTSQNLISNVAVPDLLVGETLNTAVVQQVSPTTTPALSVTVSSIAASSVSVELAAGQNETTYGFLLVVTTSTSRTIQVRGAVYVTSVGSFFTLDFCISLSTFGLRPTWIGKKNSSSFTIFILGLCSATL